MDKDVIKHTRREESLSRETIIAAAIALLDLGGESGLTFRALARQLATGAGAIYWHVANKSELLTAASDAIVVRAMTAPPAGATPADIIRAVALQIFDAMDVHPWLGSALTQAPGALPTVRILERLGQQVAALGVPHAEQWAAVSALLYYLLGVSGQNAANTEIARQHGLQRSHALEALADAWAQFDVEEFPFTRSMSKQLWLHDDRVDFLAGIDFILDGIQRLRQ